MTTFPSSVRVTTRAIAGSRDWIPRLRRFVASMPLSVFVASPEVNVLTLAASGFLLTVVSRRTILSISYIAVRSNQKHNPNNYSSRYSRMRSALDRNSDVAP